MSCLFVLYQFFVCVILGAVVNDTVATPASLTPTLAESPCNMTSSADVTVRPTQTLTLGFFGMQYLVYGPPYQMFIMGSAFTMAVDDVRSDPDLLTNHTINWVLEDSACNAPKAVAKLVP